MNVNNLTTIYDINAGCPPGRIVVSHDCDVNTRTVEVRFRQGVIPLAISTDCTAKAAFVERQTNILINDNVPCTVTESGSVLIPVDNLHRQGRFDMSIELTVTNQDGEQVLVTPFPMWITVNGSILNEAEVTEESKGTVPDLLKEAADALADAKDYEKLDNLPAINGHTLIGDQTAEDLGITGGGTTDYNELENLPKVVASDVRRSFKGEVLFDNFFFPESTDNQIHLKIKNDTIIREMLATALNNSLFTSYGILQNIPDDFFTNPYKAPIQNGVWSIDRYDLEGMPIPAIGYLFNYSVVGGRIQFYLSDRFNGEKNAYRLFQRVQYMGSFSKWKELTGGSEIVSGVVNANGTITFTDSDGNTFTTTGASVIGPQGDDYVLTNQDKTDIANIVLQLLPTTEGVEYGN